MDAFSVSLGLGMQPLRLKRIFIIGFIFGVFHIVFPVLGMFIGYLVSDNIGHYTTFASGVLLICIGSHMFFSAFTEHLPQNKRSFKYTNIGILTLGLSVSIDSLAIGLSLGITGVQTVMAILLFGSFSTFFTWTGLLIGRKVKGFLGSYSELLGGSILVSFGIHMLFIT